MTTALITLGLLVVAGIVLYILAKRSPETQEYEDPGYKILEGNHNSFDDLVAEFELHDKEGFVALVHVWYDKARYIRKPYRVYCPVVDGAPSDSDYFATKEEAIQEGKNRLIKYYKSKYE